MDAVPCGYAVAMSTRSDPGDDGSALHGWKGRVKRFLGWMTADRRVEAEGEAEARTRDRPSERTVREVEHEVKRGYDETLDDREPPGSHP
jgi:hypothetical protein